MALQRQYRPQGLQALRDVYISGGEVNLPVSPRIIATYMPGLVSFYHNALPAIIDLNRICFQHPQARIPKQFKESMLDTLEVVVRSLSKNVDKSEATSLELTAWLEQSVRAGFRTTFSQQYEGRSPYALTYARFTTLAILAKLTQSIRFFALLSQFFVKYCYHILAEETSSTEDTVLDWCNTIATCFNAAERVGCLKEVIETRDNVLADLDIAARRNTGIRIEPLVRVLEDVMLRVSVAQRRRPLMNRYYISDTVMNRGRQRQRDVPGWSEDDEYDFRARRTIDDTQSRRKMLANVPRGITTDDLEPYEKQLGLHRRAWSQDHGSASQRLRKLEEKMDELEEAITFVAAKQLTREGRHVSRKDGWADFDSNFA